MDTIKLFATNVFAGTVSTLTTFTDSDGIEVRELPRLLRWGAGLPPVPCVSPFRRGIGFSYFDLNKVWRSNSDGAYHSTTLEYKRHFQLTV